MRAMRSVSGLRLAMAIAGLVTACTPQPKPPVANIQIYQKWQFQRGDIVGDRRIVGGLGDISVALDGNAVYAPFSGKTQLAKADCIVFSSPEVPAYLFRLCGLSQPTLGQVQQGQSLGTGNLLQFATLRKQPNGTWAIVETSKEMLERTLKRA